MRRFWRGDGGLIGEMAARMTGSADIFSRDMGRDKAAIRRIAAAASAAGKPWIMPAWTRAERTAALELGAGLLVVADEFGAILSGLADAAK